jgi:hypothetical protein
MTPHEGVIALSSKRAPEPAPVRVNTHPGPDLDIFRRVRDGLLPLPDSTEGDEAA